LSTIKLKNPRNKYYDEGKTITKCPECKEELVEENNSILLAVKSKNDEAQFITNVPKSRICNNCPVVVFDKLELFKAASLGLRQEKNVEYAVIGIIHSVENEENEDNREDYIPMEPQTFNPIIASPKIGRNEKCPCGSGKKYKKCCLNRPIQNK